MVSVQCGASDSSLLSNKMMGFAAKECPLRHVVTLSVAVWAALSLFVVSAAAQASMLAAIDRRLSPEDAAACDGEGDGRLTVEEALAALRSLGRGVAPGIDGLPYEFYRAAWDHLGEQVVAALNALPRATREAA